MHEWELENFSNAYRNWLTWTFDPDRRYTILFDILYDTEYVWMLERDGDRASDGIHLRAQFEYESGLQAPEGWHDWPCSFLEMVAAMAFTMEDAIMYDPENGDCTIEWFWLMLGNLGLDIYDDNVLLESGQTATDEINGIVDRVMHRRFSKNGFGGFFPLANAVDDQRLVEFWYQMNAYVMEHKMV